MELKVWVEGIQRIVCGVTETTTCQDVVHALAHATAQTGRFILVERWRTNEQLLAPYENPLKVLMKWGEYSSEVQLILRKSNESNKLTAPSSSRSLHGNRLNSASDSPVESVGNNNIYEENLKCSSTIPVLDMDDVQTLDRNRDTRKSLTFGGLHGNVAEHSEVQMEKVAIVQPTPQNKYKDPSMRKSQKSAQSPTILGSEAGNTYVGAKKTRQVPPYREPPGLTMPLRTLPPYRDPPPPNSNCPGRPNSQYSTAATSRLSKEDSAALNASKAKRNAVQELQDGKSQTQPSNQVTSQTQNIVTAAYTQRYIELIKLVNRQRDTINSQQTDLTKFDAEISYWENKNKEHAHQMDFVTQEMNRIESTNRMIEEQLIELSHVEEESEIVRQQEKTLKSEITLLRSKLANCETELLQCKNKIRLVLEEMSSEQQHNSSGRESEVDQLQQERKMMSEMEHLQSELEQAKRLSESNAHCAETLKMEVMNLESAIVEKKLQVERLVTEMKEANLQSLAAASQDEQVKYLLEGAHKPGSTRKMIGSPRQLETAVPTSKNPHGVWV